MRHIDINITKLHQDHVAQAHKNSSNRLCCNAQRIHVELSLHLLGTTTRPPLTRANKIEILFYVNVINKNGAMPIRNEVGSAHKQIWQAHP